MVLLDSNVLLDIVTNDSVWRAWSEAALAAALTDGDDVFVNQLIYAEVSIAFRHAQELDAVLARLHIQRKDLPWEAAYLAGQAFLTYRRKGGAKTSPLPDFYIGAHALSSGFTLLTRDAKRYQTYFPALKLIAPER